MERRGLGKTGLAKLAVSTAMLGSTMVGCAMDGRASHPANISDARSSREASAAQRGAANALAKHDYAKAIGLAEAAVAAQPRDAGYRMLLGQAYLGAGRFQSAETSFADTLTLNPEHERAALNLALAQIALGKADAAKATLHDYRDKLPAADYGLAEALAGDADEAVRVLEIASRAPDVNAKTRQNLALAYALQGKWNNARVMAVQDLTPDAAEARVTEWAKYAHPGGAADQVAALLGAHPAADTGQPTRLALAGTPKSVQTAMNASTPMPAPVVAVEEAAPPPMAAPEAPAYETHESSPVQTAATFPARLPRSDTASIKQFVRHAAARNAHVAGRLHPVTGGKFVVQLGAFSNQATAEHAWARVAARVNLAGYESLSGTAHVRNASLVRVAAAGFGSRNDADTMCARIRRTGNVCFVRVQQGDAPTLWAQRHAVRVAAR